MAVLGAFIQAAARGAGVLAQGDARGSVTRPAGVRSYCAALLVALSEPTLKILSSDSDWILCSGKGDV